MRQVLIILPFLLIGGDVVADEATGRPRPLDLSAEGALAADPVLERIVPDAARPRHPGGDGGLLSSAIDVVDGVLDKLGVDREDLAEALSEVALSGAGDNWREESSGEIGLSFGVTERFSVGPSFGLRYEEENLAGPDEPWSQQVKFGARYNF